MAALRVRSRPTNPSTPCLNLLPRSLLFPLFLLSCESSDKFSRKRAQARLSLDQVTIRRHSPHSGTGSSGTNDENRATGSRWFSLIDRVVRCSCSCSPWKASSADGHDQRHAGSLLGPSHFFTSATNSSSSFQSTSSGTTREVWAVVDSFFPSSRSLLGWDTGYGVWSLPLTFPVLIITQKHPCYKLILSFFTFSIGSPLS
ncbi:hypothetical protein GE09DRAFT_1152159 [Coniochaeta sp. 2T2.1]|nr:hypothetical protein GE09DRAFT_1152159 [Coniochaeta sp. 2T2.1]